MVGVKLWVAGAASARELDPIVCRGGGVNAVIFQHTWYKTTGNPPGESSRWTWRSWPRGIPRFRYLGHTGGEWEIGFGRYGICTNVSVDIAGFDPTAGLSRWLSAKLGADRVIYGSDAGGRSFGSQMGKVMGADISEADRKAILGENLKRMMMPILRRKGIRV